MCQAEKRASFLGLLVSYDWYVGAGAGSAHRGGQQCRGSRLTVFRRLIVAFVAAPWLIGLACYLSGRLRFGAVDGIFLVVDLILLVFALRTPWGLASVFLVVRLTASAVWLLSRNLTDIGYVFVVAELTGAIAFVVIGIAARREIGEVREQRRKRRFAVDPDEWSSPEPARFDGRRRERFERRANW